MARIPEIGGRQGATCMEDLQESLRESCPREDIRPISLSLVIGRYKVNIHVQAQVLGRAKDQFKAMLYLRSRMDMHQLDMIKVIAITQ